MKAEALAGQEQETVDSYCRGSEWVFTAFKLSAM